MEVKEKTKEAKWDFPFVASSGDKKRLSDYLGEKHVILYFYPKDFTDGCTAQACEFRDSYVEFKDLDAVIIGISSDSEISHEEFKKNTAYPSNL